MQATPQAFKQVKSMLQDKGLTQNQALRVSVEDGGCSGRQYVMKIDEPQADDFILSDGGVQIVVDPASHELLKDCQVDYLDTLSDTGFKIHNPQAKRSCGCGRSFEA